MIGTTELELQKAYLAREILTATDENFIKSIWMAVSDLYHGVGTEKRDIGFLKGKAEVVFHDDWSMTPEELGMI